MRNRFLPWYIGLALVILVDAYFLFFRTAEGGPEMAQQVTLIVLPIVALGLMFLMFLSEKRKDIRERDDAKRVTQG